MQYRTLGQTDIAASVVGFGLWTVSTDWWEAGQAEGVRLLRDAFARGITFFDTADTYGNGRGEEILAQSLGDHRDAITIATKFGYDIVHSAAQRDGHGELPHDWSPQYVRAACEASLRRLSTDRIDYYQLHNPRMDAITDDALWATLDDLRREGKIRAVGVALGPALKADRQIEEGITAIRQHGAHPHIICNLLEPVLGDAIFPVAREHGVGCIIRVPHSSGLLEGHYTAETTFPPGDHRNHRPRSWLLDGVQKVEQLRFLERPDRTLGQAALQWLLLEPAVTSTLPNIYDAAQLAEFAAAPGCPPLTPDEIARVRELVAHNFGLAPAQA
jgi:aryl-alcohol dehydrogenase-like predicted oxidoreductase